MAFQTFLTVIEQFIQTGSHMEPSLFVKQREGRVFEVMVGRRESGCWPTSPTLTPTSAGPEGPQGAEFCKSTSFKKGKPHEPCILEMSYFLCTVPRVVCHVRPK